MVQEKIGNEAELPETPKIEQEILTPTEAEALKTLQSQIQTLTADKERLEGGYKGLQRTLEEKSKQTKTMADLESRIGTLQDSIELLATAMASRGVEPNESESLQDKQDVLTQLRHQRTEQENRRKQKESMEKQEEYVQKGAALYAKAEELIGDDIDSLHGIRNLIRLGDYDLAERKIAKLEKKEKPPVVTETEADKKAKMKREIMEELGLLEEHTAAPSGRSSSFTDIEAKYASGEITTAEYRKAREKEGIY